MSRLRSQRFLILLAVVLAGLSGCVGKEPQNDGGGTPERPVQTAHFSAPYTPREAAGTITKVLLDPFGFDVGQLSSGGNPADLPPGDYFFSRVDASTAAGESLSAKCRWVADRQTEVTVTSDLPPDQHVLVVQKIRQAIENPR